MKLKTKLLSILLISATVPLTAVSLYVYNAANKSLSTKVSDQLYTIRQGHSESIQEYFHNLETEVELMANDPSVVEAMQDFSSDFSSVLTSIGQNGFPAEGVSQDIKAPKDAVKGFYAVEYGKMFAEYDVNNISPTSLLPKTDIGLVLQDTYIVKNTAPLGSKNLVTDAGDGSAYSASHAKYHPLLDEFRKRYGLYDIFLIEPKNGNIVYTVFKEMDFATSLNNGPHANSNLAVAYKAALRQSSANNSILGDYAHYLPSYNQAAAFISSPIYDNGRLIGVLAFQVSKNKINKVVNNMIGLGETGKAYLVGTEDGKLRSQLPQIEENTILSLETDLDRLESMLATDGQARYVDMLNVDVVASAQAISILGLDWYIVVEQNLDEAFSALNSIKYSLLFAWAISVAFCITFGLWAARNVHRQLGADPQLLNSIATEIAEGDLSREFENPDKLHGTLKVLAATQQTLKDQKAKDEEHVFRINRLSDGMENLTTPVALGSAELGITLMNDAMRDLFHECEADIKSAVPTFNADNLEGALMCQFSDDPQELRAILLNAKSDFHYEFTAGNRFFRIIFSPQFSSRNGEMLGICMEWLDLTKEIRVLKEVDSVVAGANNGELANRVNLTDKDGAYLELSKGINGLLEVIQEFVGDVNQFLGAISDGDLSTGLDKPYQGDFTEVKTNANASVRKLKEVVNNIRSVANNVDTAAREINAGNLDLSQRTERAAASLEETSASMEEITASVSQNADNSKEAKTLALGAKNQAEKGGAVVGQAVTAMAGINESSRKISDIIGVIDDIAFQTNLLALNASVEAARAGEQGRGFAVVASEVRNLAGRSATAAKEIKDLIEDSVSRVENGAKLVNESGQTLDGIVDQVKKVTDIVTEISASSQEQADGIGLVNNAITQLDEATQQNAALVEEASAASQSSSDQANNLIDLISFFSTSADEVHGNTSHSPPDLQSMAIPVTDPSSIPSMVSANEAQLGSPAKVSNLDDEDWTEF